MSAILREIQSKDYETSLCLLRRNKSSAWVLGFVKQNVFGAWKRSNVSSLKKKDDLLNLNKVAALHVDQ